MMDTFDSEFERINAESSARATEGVMGREDAAIALVSAARALMAEAARLVDTPWEDGDEAVLQGVTGAIEDWRRAVAWKE